MSASAVVQLDCDGGDSGQRLTRLWHAGAIERAALMEGVTR